MPPYQNELEQDVGSGQHGVHLFVRQQPHIQLLSGARPCLPAYPAPSAEHQVNVTGTLIHTKNNRKYKSTKDENAPLADIRH